MKNFAFNTGNELNSQTELFYFMFSEWEIILTQMRTLLFGTSQKQSTQMTSSYPLLKQLSPDPHHCNTVDSFVSYNSV
jgi:hypothetical protein